MAKTGRNKPCPCGSGKKYKKCCMQIGMTPKPKVERKHKFGREEAGLILTQFLAMADGAPGMWVDNAPTRHDPPRSLEDLK